MKCDVQNGELRSTRRVMEMRDECSNSTRRGREHFSGGERHAAVHFFLHAAMSATCFASSAQNIQPLPSSVPPPVSETLLTPTPPTTAE